MLSWLERRSSAIQAVVGIVGIFTTALVAFIGFQIAQRQLALMELERRPQLSVQQFRASDQDPLAKLGVVVVSNSNEAGPALGIGIDFLPFLRVEYLDRADDSSGTPEPEILLPPRTRFAEVPVEKLYVAETSQTETGTLMELFPYSVDTNHHLQTLESGLVETGAEAGLTIEVVGVDPVVYIRASYSDLFGDFRRVSFLVSSPPMGVERISDEVWVSHAFKWHSLGPRSGDVNQMTVPELLDVFLARKDDPEIDLRAGT